MAVTLEDLYRQVEHIEIKLLAGNDGMDRLVTWTHMVDSETLFDFLEGGEVIFTTGLGLHEQLSLMDLVKGVYEKGASGIVINIGPYIKAIPDEILQFGNEKNFPIFEVPWNVHMAQIMRIFCFSILQEEQKNIELTAAFNNALFCPKQEELYVPSLLQKGYLVREKYRVCIIRVKEHGKMISEQRLKMLENKLKHRLTHYNRQSFVLNVKGDLVVIFLKQSVEEGKLLEIMKVSEILFYPSEAAKFSMGMEVESIRQLSKSYETALKVARLQTSGLSLSVITQGRNQLMNYDKVGIFQLFFEINNQTVLETYIRNSIMPLIEYDNINHGDLTDVLYEYIRHNGSVKETAEQFFVHRNTINYKIKKAEEILGVRLSELEERFRIKVGFMLYRYLQEGEDDSQSYAAAQN